jgi:hypothetical protein
MLAVRTGIQLDEVHGVQRKMLLPTKHHLLKAIQRLNLFSHLGALTARGDGHNLSQFQSSDRTIRMSGGTTLPRCFSWHAVASPVERFHFPNPYPRCVVILHHISPWKSPKRV